MIHSVKENKTPGEPIKPSFFFAKETSSNRSRPAESRKPHTDGKESLSSGNIELHPDSRGSSRDRNTSLITLSPATSLH